MGTVDQLYRDYAAETIYLIPDSDEGRLIYVWSDDPAPSEHHVRDEAVEYIRKDIHDAHADMLENRGDELQMMLADVEKERDAALEREQALAAKLTQWNDWMNSLALYYDADMQAWENKGWDLRNSDPVDILTKHDLIKQAEALEEIAVALKQWDHAAAAQATRIRAHVKRQQAAAI